MFLLINIIVSSAVTFRLDSHSTATKKKKKFKDFSERQFSMEKLYLVMRKCYRKAISINRSIDRFHIYFLLLSFKPLHRYNFHKNER